MKAYQKSLCVLSIVAGVSACGGGGGGGSTAGSPVIDPSPQTPPLVASSALVTEVPAPTYMGEKLAVFNRLNEDRTRCDFGKLAQDARLDASAQGHGDYININGASNGHDQINGRQGFTGVRSFDRMVNAGYSAIRTDEDLSATSYGSGPVASNTNAPYRSSLTALPLIEDLKNLYAAPYHLASLFTGYRDIGIGHGLKKENLGALEFNNSHLVLNFGIPTGSVEQKPEQSAVLTFPCDGTAGVNPFFIGEEPNPFPGVQYSTSPYGQPVYVYVTRGQTLNMTAGSITEIGGGSVATRWLNSSNDPNSILGANQWFLVPTTYLKNSTFYDVALVGTNTGLVSTANPTGSFTKNFRFKTGTFTSD